MDVYSSYAFLLKDNPSLCIAITALFFYPLLYPCHAMQRDGVVSCGFALPTAARDYFVLWRFVLLCMWETPQNTWCVWKLKLIVARLKITVS